MQQIMETLFDVVYLITVISLGIIMIKKSKGVKEYLLFGIMAVVLGLGDSFHLVPRIIALCTTGFEDYLVPLGIGKFITSITMTGFYILLYYVWRIRYKIEEKKLLTLSFYVLALARIILCLFPQNNWTSVEGSLAWAIYRNIPFVIIGLIIIILFYSSSRKNNDKNFKNMWLTIVLSFVFYIPVLLWADVNPLIGMLMIPKTCAYVWTVLIGYIDMKNKLK